MYSLKDLFGNYEKSFLSSVVKYDTNHTTIERIWFSAENEPHRRCVYKYNDKGDIIDEAEYNTKNELVERTVYKYDDVRKIIDVSQYKSDGKLSEKCIIKHDGKGHKTEQTEYNPNGDLMWKFVFSFDNSGLPVVYSYDSRGNLSGKNVSRYNKYGKMLEENQYKADGKKSWKNEYKYDTKGNCIEKSNYDYSYEKTGLIIHMKEVCRYDDDNNCVEKVYFSDDGMDNREVYEYDEMGNKTKEIVTRSEAEIFWQGTIYEYEYYK